MRTNELKRRMDEAEDEYQDARDEEFDAQFASFLDDFTSDECRTEEDIQGFLDSFDFMAVGDWCYDKVMNDEADIGDAKYQQMKDERSGL